MNILLGIASAIVAASAFVAACKVKGFAEGQKCGYQRGFQEGHLAADQWWLSRDFEVREVKQKIQDEERWP